VKTYEPFIYEINHQAPLTLELPFLTNVSQFGCPFTCELSIKEREMKRTPTAEDYKVISFDKTASLLKIEATNFDLHGRTWTIELTKRSVLSNEPEKAASHLIVVKFKDLCYDSQLVAP